MDSKKTQKIVVVILVITALLGIIGAILVYYLSTADRTGLRDLKTVEDREYCACIVAYTTPTCSDCSCAQIETQTLESQIGEVIDGVCSLDCDTAPIEEEEEEIAKTITCLIPNIKGDSCHSVSVRNIDTRELLIPPIRTERPVLITGSFVPRHFGDQEEEFTKFSFIINGERTELDVDSTPSTVINGQKTYLPELEFSNFQNIDTLTIQATAYSDREPGGTTLGKYCYKQYDLQQEKGPFCSSLLAYVQEGSRANTTVVNRLEINTPNLTRESEISIEFDFDHRDIANVRTGTIPQNLLEEILVNETIFLEYRELYSTPSLFLNETGFPVFDTTALNTDRIKITAQLYVDDTTTDSSLCTEDISLFGVIDEERIVDEEIDEDREADEEEEEEVRPDLYLTMEGPSCVRKAADEESTSRTNYRITIQNNSTTAQEIESIKGKLPLGFRYVENTTSINGVLINDDILEVTAVGESQDILWSNNWTIQSNTALVLEYGVNVTHRALDGENQSEAVATPVNIPEDMSRLRAEVVTLIDDECMHEEDLPDTGTLTFMSFAVGIFVLILGILIYQGRISLVDEAILKLINTKVIKKNFSPKEYFEDSILEKEDDIKKD